MMINTETQMDQGRENKKLQNPHAQIYLFIYYKYICCNFSSQDSGIVVDEGAEQVWELEGVDAYRETVSSEHIKVAAYMYSQWLG